MSPAGAADQGATSKAGSFARPVVPAVVAQHVEDAAVLRNTRSVLVRAPHVELKRLARLDERLNAHLDGALVAGDEGIRVAQAALESPGAGQLFVAAVLAIERRDEAQIGKLLALAEALPDEGPRALASAFGWVAAQSLRGLTAPLLQSAQPLRRWLGIAACAAHRVDLGAALAGALSAPQSLLRVTALRTAGRLGRIDLMPVVLAQLRSDDPATQAAAAWAAVLLGDRRDGALALGAQARSAEESTSLPALQLHLLAAEPEAARATVRELVSQGAPMRTSLRATAWAGDVQAVPWLVKQMASDEHARLAGEAFSLLTGADLALMDLERKEPGQVATGPNDGPSDDNVALDEDESLPWPDVERVQAWWQRNAASLPAGQRCFMGAAAGPQHCQQVLRTGAQRQRHAAALLLALTKPGSVLFNIAAPAWRQQRALGLPMRVV
jgi:uncharacterized protein (TIGR02270 family)